MANSMHDVDELGNEEQAHGQVHGEELTEGTQKEGLQGGTSTITDCVIERDQQRYQHNKIKALSKIRYEQI